MRPTAAMMTSSTATPVTADELLSWFQRTRRRTRALFDLVTPDAYLARPISLRHPIVFYEGHIAAFYVNTIIRKGLGRPGIEPAFETLFARGIDPADEAAAARKTIFAWPPRQAILEYGRAADALVEEAIRSGDAVPSGDRPAPNALIARAQAVFACIEHELMHQETLLYIFHRLPAAAKNGAGGPLSSEVRRPMSDVGVGLGPRTSDLGRIHIPAGLATLGARPGEIPFGWDNEFDTVRVKVPAFSIDRFNVTNEEYLAFVEAGGYDREDLWTPAGWAWVRSNDVRHPLFWEAGDGRESGRPGVRESATSGPPDVRTSGRQSAASWSWRGFFGPVPLEARAPVYVTHAEASAFARWKGGRLPSEAEYHRAAYGAPGGDERAQPWGDTAPDASRHGNFDFTHWDPVPVGRYPDGASAWGVEDLVGNGWEWTSTVFEPFAGFQPLPSYPEYSADFFDGCHYVMKGASPATSRELVRRTFRNWFRPEYPYVYATFRVAGDAR